MFSRCSILARVRCYETAVYSKFCSETRSGIKSVIFLLEISNLVSCILVTVVRWLSLSISYNQNLLSGENEYNNFTWRLDSHPQFSFEAAGGLMSWARSSEIEWRESWGSMSDSISKPKVRRLLHLEWAWLKDKNVGNRYSLIMVDKLILYFVT